MSKGLTKVFFDIRHAFNDEIKKNGLKII